MTTLAEDSLRDIQRNLSLLPFGPNNPAQVVCNFDNTSHIFFSRSSEESFFSRSVSFSKPWEPTLVTTQKLSDNFRTKSREINQKFDHSALESLLGTREKLFCYQQLKNLSSQIDKLNRNQPLISRPKRFLKHVECISGINTHSFCAQNFHYFQFFANCFMLE